MGSSRSGWYRGARPRCEHRAALDLADRELLRPGAILNARWRIGGDHYGAVVHVDDRGLSVA